MAGMCLDELGAEGSSRVPLVALSHQPGGCTGLGAAGGCRKGGFTEGGTLSGSLCSTHSPLHPTEELESLCDPSTNRPQSCSLCLTASPERPPGTCSPQGHLCPIPAPDGAHRVTHRLLSPQ